MALAPQLQVQGMLSLACLLCSQGLATDHY